jgi:O-antigen ligase
MFIGLFMLIALMFVAAPQRVRARAMETFAHEKTYKVLGKELNVAESAAARIDSWKIGFQRWAKRPLLGQGIPTGVVVDNQYMRVLSETGLAGFLAFLWIIRMFFRIAWKTYTGFPENYFAQAISFGFIAGLAGLLMLSASAAVFILIRIMEPFWFLAAIVAVLPEIINQEKSVLKTNE